MKPQVEHVEKELRKVLASALQELKISDATAFVALVPGRDLKRFKSQYYKKRIYRDVDVLAFGEPAGFPHPELKGRFLGEIYLNEDEAADLTRLLLLLIHGLLHLLGYSHDGKHDTLKMQSLEKRLMRRISK